MDRDAHFVMNRIQQAWNELCAGMLKMYQSSSVRPSGPYDVFVVETPGTAGEVKLHIGPVVFNVPERADKRDANLYIVVSGWLSFEGADVRSSPLKTRGFGTKIGYFRSKEGALEHVYGAHYDIDESTPGHPVFHSQMTSQLDFHTNILESYHLQAESRDFVSKILTNVRTPTAQMDVFSVFIQICADHLIFPHSSQETKDAFTSLRESCSFFGGTAHRLSYLNSEAASTCYRSNHWYAAPASVAPPQA